MSHRRIRFVWCLATLAFVGCNQSSTQTTVAPAPEPWPFVAVVDGNSMAPTFWGQHIRTSCPDCRCSFVIGTEWSQPPAESVCPNCGYEWAFNLEAPVCSGSRLFYSPLLDGDLQPCNHPDVRFQVVAFKNHEISQGYGIKRIVGLPGEEIELRGGDLYANGEIVRKSFAEQRRVAIVVHDQQFVPGSVEKLPHEATQNFETGDARSPRWKPTTYSPSVGDVETAVKPTVEIGKPIDWIAYEHRRTFSSRSPLRAPMPIKDVDAFNVEPVRDLVDCHDLAVRFDCCARTLESLHVRIHNGFEWCEWKWDLGAGSVQVFQSDKLVGQADVDTTVCVSNLSQDRSRDEGQLASGFHGCEAETCSVFFSTFDQQLCAVLNETEYLRVGATWQGESSPLSQPIMIGWKQRADVAPNSTQPIILPESIIVLRDIVYLDKDFSIKPLKFKRLADDEYLLLGDNPPISRDSRHWNEPAVRLQNIVGTIIVE
jgi:signal peptidase I